MTVLLQSVDRVTVGAQQGKFDKDGMGVVDVVDWLRRAQSVPRELHPYVGRHRAVSSAC
jgi:hypothetical protein